MFYNYNYNRTESERDILPNSSSTQKLFVIESELFDNFKLTMTMMIFPIVT